MGLLAGANPVYNARRQSKEALAMQGFLGTSASLRADLVLIVTLVLGIAALASIPLARRRRFPQHCRLLTVATLLNWLPLLVGMIPQWIGLIGSGLSSPLISVPMIHGSVGLIVQVLMTYVVVRMNWLKRLPPRRPGRLMRVTLALWLISLVSGLSVYVLYYTSWLG
jgi:uncharacterized membrane protein YozB (DUF420 family)